MNITTHAQRNAAETTPSAVHPRGRRHRRTAFVASGVLAVIALGGGSAALLLPGDAVGSPTPAQKIQQEGRTSHELSELQHRRVAWLERCAPSYPSAPC